MFVHVHGKRGGGCSGIIEGGGGGGMSAESILRMEFVVLDGHYK